MLIILTLYCVNLSFLGVIYFTTSARVSSCTSSPLRRRARFFCCISGDFDLSGQFTFCRLNHGHAPSSRQLKTVGPCRTLVNSDRLDLHRLTSAFQSDGSCVFVHDLSLCAPNHAGGGSGWGLTVCDAVRCRCAYRLAPCALEQRLGGLERAGRRSGCD